jgi:hypothetical protein
VNDLTASEHSQNCHHSFPEIEQYLPSWCASAIDTSVVHFELIPICMCDRMLPSVFADTFLNDDDRLPKPVPARAVIS